jgi:enoyl-CoA hydratase/carnithine racemase
MGLVNRVISDAELEAYVGNMAQTISENAPLTVNSVKFIVGQALAHESQKDLKACDALVSQCFASQDYIEGRKAFMEKRKPNFSGS